MEAPRWFHTFLIAAGLLMVLAGVLLYVFPKMGQGWPRLLPGDVLIKRPNLVVYLPLASSLLFSLLLSLFFYLIRR